MIPPNPRDLSRLLSERIRATGPLSFAEFMRTALYEPGLGYYRRDPAAGPGRRGDFFTAVSVGPLYGLLLAEWVHQLWRSKGAPRMFTIAEQGGHGGELLADVAVALAERHPDCFENASFLSIEPDPGLQTRQAATWADRPALGSKERRHIADFTSHDPSAGVLLANELLDAFPVHSLEWTKDGWRENVVDLEGESDAFAWVTGPVTPELERDLAVLSTSGPPPEGYRIELCPDRRKWVNGLRKFRSDWSVLIADYGFTPDRRWAPERADGSVRRFFSHQSDDNVLSDPGRADLTADVDFGALAEEWRQAGGCPGDYEPQGIFLTKAARAWLLEREGSPQSARLGFRDPLIRQFQTLTHPAMMGRSFWILPLHPGTHP